MSNVSLPPESVPPISTAEAGRLLGVGPHCVRRLLRRRELRGFVVGRRVKVDLESVVLYQRRHAVGGREPAGV
jgi:excisionase family DNA binding protein